jgi:hypothetical protein
MKKFMIGVVASVALTLIPGCGKKEAPALKAPAPSALKDMPAAVPEKSIPAAPAAAAKELEKAAAEAPAAAAQVAAEVKTTTSTFDKLVADAQKLIADKKYQDALTKLQAGLQQPALDAAQKSTLQKLIDQVKAALAGGAADVKAKADSLLKGVGGK